MGKSDVQEGKGGAVEKKRHENQERTKSKDAFLNGAVTSAVDKYCIIRNRTVLSTWTIIACRHTQAIVHYHYVLVSARQYCMLTSCAYRLSLLSYKLKGQMATEIPHRRLSSREETDMLGNVN